MVDKRRIGLIVLGVAVLGAVSAIWLAMGREGVAAGGPFPNGWRAEDVPRLLREGTDPGKVVRGRLPLIQAVEMKATEAVRAMIAAGADPNAFDVKKRSAIGAAAETEASLLEICLTSGRTVDLNAAFDGEGLLPLHRAVAGTNLRAVEMLVRAGANPLATSDAKWGRVSAVSFAIGEGNAAIVSVLVQRAATLNTRWVDEAIAFAKSEAEREPEKAERREVLRILESLRR